MPETQASGRDLIAVVDQIAAHAAELPNELAGLTDAVRLQSEICEIIASAGGLDHSPPVLTKELHRSLSMVLDWHRRVREGLVLEGQLSTDHRQRRAQQATAQFHECNEQFLSVATPLLLMTACKRNTDLLSGSNLQSLTEAAETARDDVLSLRAQIDVFVKKATVDIHRGMFAQAAKWHLIGALVWLGVTVGLAAVVAWYLIQKVADLHARDVAGEQLPSWPSLAAAAVLTSVAISAVLWTARQYRVSMHNREVNRHRERALGTFRSFVEASKHNDEVAGQVLLHAAKAIFDPQSTGFVSGEADQPLQILEIVRGVGKSPPGAV